MRLIVTASVAALALVFAGTAADAKKAPAAKRYTFTVACPILSPFTVTTGSCTAAGKSKEEARAICLGQNNFCFIKDPKKGKKK